jgi:hypothetical protein
VADIESPAQEARCTERRKGHARVQIGGRVPDRAARHTSHGLRLCALKRSRVEALQARPQRSYVGIRGLAHTPPSDERRVYPFVVRGVAEGGDVELAAMPSFGSAAPERVMRAHAVTAMMIAAATASVCRQPSAEMAMSARPSAA